MISTNPIPTAADSGPPIPNLNAKQRKAARYDASPEGIAAKAAYTAEHAEPEKPTESEVDFEARMETERLARMAAANAEFEADEAARKNNESAAPVETPKANLNTPEGVKVFAESFRDDPPPRSRAKPQSREVAGLAERIMPPPTRPKVAEVTEVTVDSLIVEGCLLMRNGIVNAGKKFLAARKLAGGYTPEYKVALARAGISEVTERRAIQFTKDPQRAIEFREDDAARTAAKRSESDRGKAPDAAPVTDVGPISSSIARELAADVIDVAFVEVKPIPEPEKKEVSADDAMAASIVEVTLFDLFERIEIWTNTIWPTYSKEQRACLRKTSLPKFEAAAERMMQLVEDLGAAS